MSAVQFKQIALMFLLLLLVGLAWAECEDEDAAFGEAVKAMERLAADALDRGLGRQDSIAELEASDDPLVRGSLFHDMYPVIFMRTALERKTCRQE